MPARRSGSPVGHYGIPLPCELLPRYRFTVRYNTPKQRIDAATSGRPTGSMPRAVEKMCVDEGVRRMPEDCARHLGPSAIRVAGRRTLGSSYDVSSRIPTPGPPNRPQRGGQRDRAVNGAPAGARKARRASTKVISKRPAAARIVGQAVIRGGRGTSSRHRRLNGESACCCGSAPADEPCAQRQRAHA